MPSSPNRFSCQALPAVLCLAVLALAGCQPEEQVASYTVAATSMPRQPLDAAVELARLDHILVAIVPQKDQAWFFKLVGKAAVIERQRQAFHDFLTTIDLAESSSETPSWQLPDGWQQKKVAGAMRVATLLVPDSEGELELAVSSLPLTSRWDEFLVPNVNRWLGQLSRSRLPSETVLKLAKQAPIRGGEATVFELSGIMQQRPMGGNPHAGLGIAAPPSTASQPAVSPPTAQQKELTYDTPEGWLPGRMSSLRKAAFALPGGGPSDEVAVTSFPTAGTQMGDVGFNVKRWADQLGAAQPTADKIGEVTKAITVAGLAGTYVTLVGPSAADPQLATHVAMVKRQGQIWFFKMTGKFSVVDSQQEAFRKFLDSVRFL